MQQFESFKLSENFSQKLLFQHPSELQEADWKLPKTLFTFRPRTSKTIVMEPRMRKPGPSTLGMAWRGGNARTNEGTKQEQAYYRSFSQGNTKKSTRAGYFGLESVMLLVCLTVSLLILPVILPPLPPPPFLLLLLPIGIFGLLMILAFMPSNVRDLTYT
ncbi:hypothetical protein RND81_05G134300 [Saponaria officinalis]|uniref:ARGOS-like protein n=1 Tax=Saponaria officinalis TaxID=3572 RepID=A0AAW1KWQ1_SAPOF